MQHFCQTSSIPSSSSFGSWNQEVSLALLGLARTSQNLQTMIKAKNQVEVTTNSSNSQTFPAGRSPANFS